MTAPSSDEVEPTAGSPVSEFEHSYPTPPRSVTSPSSRASSEDDDDSVRLHGSAGGHAHGDGDGDGATDSPPSSTGGWELQSVEQSPAQATATGGSPGPAAQAATRLSPTIYSSSTLFPSPVTDSSTVSEPASAAAAELPTSPPLQAFPPATSAQATTQLRLGTDTADAARASAPWTGGADAASDAQDSEMGTASAPRPHGSPTRRFDPFAPLSPTRTAFPFVAPPASSGSSGRYVPPSARPRSTSPAAAKTSPFLQTQAGLAREHRPSSLYLPLDEGPPLRPDASGMTPTWPFSSGDNQGAFQQPEQRPPSFEAAGTPSSIHPSYGERKPSPRPHGTPLAADDERPSLRRPSLSDYAEPLSRRPSPNVGATPSWSAITVDAADLRRAPSALGDMDGAAAAKHKYDSSPASRHGSTFSLGTHALLSSRAAPSSRLARSLDTPTSWLILYFSFNLGLTLFNKLVLQGFPFPWTLTGIQMLSGTIGTQVALNRGFFTQTRLTTREGIIMVAFSSLYTINIAVSNLSLHLVTVPFHQCVRALTPLATIVLSVMFLNKRPSRETYFSLLPVVFGVVFATFGEYNYTMRGLILTLLGMVLAAIKTIVTNRVQVGRLKLHPLDLLIRMSPLAFMQCVLWGWYSGELERVRVYGATEMTQSKAIALLMNGIIAFGLNVVSFTANKKTSALTMTVAANVKQVLTIVLAVLIFHINLNATNMFGITLTLGGGAWYAKVELSEKSRQASLSNARLLDGSSEKRAPS